MMTRDQVLATTIAMATAAALCCASAAQAGQSFRKNAPRIEACKQAIINYYVQKSREPVTPDTIQSLEAPLVAACKRHRGDPVAALKSIGNRR